MEHRYQDHIEVYPGHKQEVHFCELTDKQLDEMSDDDIVPWSSGDARLTKTAVFIERFFNRRPCKELAERFGVKENTIVCMFRDAVDSVENIIEALDSRREGVKAVKSDKFTEDQKIFMLSCVFGFTQEEVARMFNCDRRVINRRVKRMSDRYQALFAERKESPIEDPPITEKLTRADVVALVDAYTEQGLSHRAAYKRVADRQGERLGRPVKVRAIESRYRKATSPQTA